MIDRIKLNMKMVEQGYSQRTLANKMSKSKNTINAIFTGKRQPRLDEVIRMCEILKIEEAEEKTKIFLN